MMARCFGSGAAFAAILGKKKGTLCQPVGVNKARQAGGTLPNGGY
jgi:hypothetical protein